jgi:hypothetical protein
MTEKLFKKTTIRNPNFEAATDAQDSFLKKFETNEPLIFLDETGKTINEVYQEKLNENYGSMINSFFNFIEHDSDDDSSESEDTRGINVQVNTFMQSTEF